MKRPKRKRAREEAVRIAVEILDRKVGPSFNSKKHLYKLKIHKNPKSRYFLLFLNITEYLEEFRDRNKNKISSMLKDYYFCVYNYYARFGRIPVINQLSPSVSNKIRFEEWTSEFEREYGEEYLISEDYETDYGTDFEIEITEFDDFIEV